MESIVDVPVDVLRGAAVCTGPLFFAIGAGLDGTTGVRTGAWVPEEVSFVFSSGGFCCVFS
jgi:hypothetical protein